jgi:hypothetical protein
VVVALLLDLDEVLASATMVQAGRLREELARDVFPGEALALHVCRGPMSYGPGDVPFRDVVITQRHRPGAPRPAGDTAGRAARVSAAPAA